MFHRPTIIRKIEHHDAVTTLERKTRADHLIGRARISQKLRRPARKQEVVRSRVRSGFSCQDSRITEGCRAASKIVNGCARRSVPTSRPVVPIFVESARGTSRAVLHRSARATRFFFRGLRLRGNRVVLCEYRSKSARASRIIRVYGIYGLEFNGIGFFAINPGNHFLEVII